MKNNPRKKKKMFSYAPDEEIGYDQIPGSDTRVMQ